MNCIFCYIKRALVFITENINFTRSKIIKQKIVKFFNPIGSLKMKDLSLKILKKQKNIMLL